MKKTLLLFLILMPTLVMSQKIDKNEIDDFTGAATVSTSWERINLGNSITGINHLLFKLSSVEGVETFHMKWVTDKRLAIEEDAEFMIKLKDGKVITLKAVSSEFAKKGDGAYGAFSWAAKLGIYAIYYGDMSALRENSLVEKIRIYSDKGYVDIKIGNGGAKKIQKAYTLLQEAVSKL